MTAHGDATKGKNLIADLEPANLVPDLLDLAGHLCSKNGLPGLRDSKRQPEDGSETKTYLQISQSTVAECKFGRKNSNEDSVGLGDGLLPLLHLKDVGGSVFFSHNCFKMGHRNRGGVGRGGG